MMSYEDALLSSLKYDPETGVFSWAKDVSFKQRAGVTAGTLTKRGYVMIQLSGRRTYAHRLAWLFMNGSWPVEEIDHINGTTNDNRACNLRQATRTENARNTRRKPSSKGLPKGVLAKRRHFEARIRDGAKTRHLGCFRTAEEAHQAYLFYAQKIHGEFWCSTSSTHVRAA